MKKWMHSLLGLLLAVALTACGSNLDGIVTEQPTQGYETEDAEAVTDVVEDSTAVDETENADIEDAEAVESTTESGVDISADSESADSETIATDEATDDTTVAITEDGTYTSKDDVALYIHTYGHLPDNFITKKEAEKLGWQGGSLEPYAPGKSIGGSRFGNYEGLLPEKDGRTYTECDIDTLGASKRGAKRIVFSNDGLIYYTGDHYETFELLYGEE